MSAKVSITNNGDALNVATGGQVNMQPASKQILDGAQIDLRGASSITVNGVQAAAITDATGDDSATVNAILAVLRGMGAVAT